MLNRPLCQYGEILLLALDDGDGTTPQAAITPAIFAATSRVICC